MRCQAFQAVYRLGLKHKKKAVLQLPSPWRTLRIREGTHQHGQEAAQCPADVYSFLPYGSNGLSWLHFIAEPQNTPVRGCYGFTMSMNALLPRTLSAQVCNRAQLQCLRRIRVQGPLRMFHDFLLDTE